MSDQSKIDLLQKFKRGELPQVVPKEAIRIETALSKPQGASSLLPTDFNRVKFSYNPDGSLEKMVFRQGNQSFSLSFVWSFDGTLSEIIKEQV